MNEIFVAICFLIVLIITVIIALRINLNKYNSNVHASRYVLNKFEPDNTAPKLTKMIEFHKNNEFLNKYNVK